MQGCPNLPAVSAPPWLLTGVPTCPPSLPLHARELCSPNWRVWAAGSKGHVRSCGMHQHVPAWPRPRLIPPWIRSLSCLEKAFHCFILSCRITLCPFPVPTGRLPCLVVHPWYHLLHKPFPSISWHIPVPGVPMSASFGMSRAEGWCPGALGCSCSAERPPTAPSTAAPHFQMHMQRNSLD